MVDEMDMRAEQTEQARRLRTTIETLVTRKSVLIKTNGNLIDYDIVVNPEGRILLPGVDGHFEPKYLEKIVEALVEVLPMAEERFIEYQKELYKLKKENKNAKL